MILAICAGAYRLLASSVGVGARVESMPNLKGFPWTTCIHGCNRVYTSYAQEVSSRTCAIEHVPVGTTLVTHVVSEAKLFTAGVSTIEHRLSLCITKRPYKLDGSSSLVPSTDTHSLWWWTCFENAPGHDFQSLYSISLIKLQVAHAYLSFIVWLRLLTPTHTYTAVAR